MADKPVTCVHDLERYIDLQHRDWRFQRIGWAFLALIILCALGGLFGGAGLFLTAQRYMEGTPALLVEYYRFARMQSPMELKVAPQGVPGDSFSLWVGGDYLHGLRIDAITPTPREAHGEAGGIRYRFSGWPERVTFHVTPSGPGSLSGSIGGSPNDTLIFHQFIYP